MEIESAEQLLELLQRRFDEDDGTRLSSAEARKILDSRKRPLAV